METGDIQIKNAIVHIMDTSLGMAVYSDVELITVLIFRTL